MRTTTPPRSDRAVTISQWVRPIPRNDTVEVVAVKQDEGVRLLSPEVVKAGCLMREAWAAYQAHNEKMGGVRRNEESCRLCRAYLRAWCDYKDAAGKDGKP